MKLSEVKRHLENLEQLDFYLPNSQKVESHFHVTEVGQVSKHFIDCGGVVRTEKVVNFQLWSADDIDHRIEPKKLMNIIELSEKILHIEDLEVEVEYQAETIGKYGLDFEDNHFVLTTKQTDCLAKDNCGIPVGKPKMKISELQANVAACCTPESGCC
ncbi:hypothetical protein IMCC3317_12390 [Kordia antarctica]|uniref:Uncharacterized protein n=1 Tax=Kordia antarctica TaxID=1218801 RepID=A0A7L4ZHC8_9FLAO|nr:DUF6428 family protein [Kordia antarctica]QHI35891.1 hypothetical protein IMCC3317_12390 [Kordia antarctica]